MDRKHEWNRIESRSLSSWLQLRGKLNQRQEIPFGSGPSELIIKGNGFPIPQRSPSQFSLFPTQKHQSLQQSQPTSFPISNKLNDPLFYVPTLSDTSGIDYWLKFIEQANLDEPSIPLIEKSKNNFDNSNSLKSSTLYRRVKGNRNRNRSRGHSISRYKSRPKIMKLRPDGSKYQENDYDTEPDLLSDYSGKLKSSKPVEYDSSPRCDKFTDEICIDDFEYPENAILDEIFKRKDIFQLMYSEVKGDQPMVDGMERDEEESFSQDYYYNNNEPDTDDYGDGEQPTYPYNRTEYQNDLMDNDNDNRNQQTSSSEKNQKVTGFVCRSEVLYAKPKLARNIKGKWRVIVNAGDFTQTLRLEKCTKANSECRFISDHKYGSRCAQINAIHRLLVFEKGKGFYIDTFRVPTACTCHVHSTKQPYDQDSNTEGSTNNIKRDKPNRTLHHHHHQQQQQSLGTTSATTATSNLGETLWSLLGTGTNDRSNVKPTSINQQNYVIFPESSNSKANLELLKLLPQLSSIAPDHVLEQLLDDYGDMTIQSNGQTKLNNHRGQPFHKSSSKVTTNELQQLLLAHAASRDRDLNEPTLSYVRPTSTNVPVSSGISRNGGSNSPPPVVQLIHVPVDDRDHSQRSRFRPINVNGNKRYLFTTDGKYLQSQSKTNSSVASPPTPTIKIDETNGPESKVKADDNKETNKLKQILDKKVNFSYHPILEYISK
ncbi:Neurotrophin 1 Source FlyBase [Blomia tropicalis]|nr:Neurotrophin 1 Source FlyBase [Blomia tropicalis]